MEIEKIYTSHYDLDGNVVYEKETGKEVGAVLDLSFAEVLEKLLRGESDVKNNVRKESRTFK